MKLKEKIGLIGCGNMGSAILGGLLEKKLVRASQVTVFDVVRTKSNALRKKLKVKVARSNSDLIQKSDVVLLAVKPQDLAKLGREVKSSFRSSHVVLSILAGTPIQKLKSNLGSKAKIVRAMPNLGAQVTWAITAITSHNQPALHIAERVFSGCGIVIRLQEKHFDLVTAISGSGPAYFFLLMELLSNFGMRHGLNRRAAEQLAVQTALGSAVLARVSSHTPGELREMVTSKKGTTDAALQYLEKHGFEKIFVGGLAQAVKRSKEISRSS